MASLEGGAGGRVMSLLCNAHCHAALPMAMPPTYGGAAQYWMSRDEDCRWQGVIIMMRLIWPASAVLRCPTGPQDPSNPKPDQPPAPPLPSPPLTVCHDPCSVLIGELPSLAATSACCRARSYPPMAHASPRPVLPPPLTQWVNPMVHPAPMSSLTCPL
jgi:hypothetical protein